MAAELVRAGVDGLVLFNRFYAPDIDLLTLRATRSLPLSTAAELPLVAGVDRAAVQARQMLAGRQPRAWRRMSRS